jgi:hypothetical protein
MRSLFQSQRFIRRFMADYYLLLSIVVFAATVILTRLFLEITGYPKLGNENLHIAHVLWGGLILFVATLLALTFSNSGVYQLVAILSGIGMGLFIDEVGKFITRSNDYFYPPAAPIIYGVFLISVFVYLEIRNFQPVSARQSLYTALEMMMQAVDQKLNAGQKRLLQAELEEAEQLAIGPEARQIAGLLRRYIAEYHAPVKDERSAPVKAALAFTGWVKDRVGRVWHRRVLVLGLGLPSLLALFELGMLVWILLNPHQRLNPLVNGIFSSGELNSVREIQWFVARLTIDSMTGLITLAAAIFLLARREHVGVELGIISLVLSLTAVNLITFYLDQFKAISNSLFQFGMLWLMLSYKRWYLPTPRAQSLLERLHKEMD